MPNLKVGTKHPLYDKLVPQWIKARDFGDGQEAVKARTTTYLPAMPGQKDAAGNLRADGSYMDVLERAPLFEAVPKAVEAFVSTIFRKEPQVEPNGDTQLEDFLNNVDGCGNTMVEFLTEAAADVINPGRIGFLLEAPRAARDDDGQPLRITVAQREALEQRPYVVTYRAEDIWNWDVVRVSGSARKQLVEIHLHEEFDASRGMAGADPEAGQVRVLYLAGEDEETTPLGEYAQQVYQMINGEWQEAGDPVRPEVGGQRERAIPFFWANWADQTATPRRPLLMGMVNTNCHHYTLAADHRHGLAYGGRPQPYIINHQPSMPLTEGEDPEEAAHVGDDDPDEFRIGSEWAWMIYGDNNPKVGYLEFTGQGLKPLKEEMRDLEGHMAQLGARFLAPERKQVETEEVARIHRMGEHGTLGRVAGVLEGTAVDITETAIRWMAVAADASIVFSRDFFPNKLSAPMLTALVKAWMNKAIDFEDLHAALISGEVRSSLRTIDEVREALEAENGEEELDTDPEDFVEEPEEEEVEETQDAA